MQFYTEWRLLGDDYGGNFSNGLTLMDSESKQNSKITSETENETVYTGKYGHTVRCIHEQKGDVTFCKTIFENTSDSNATIELLSSFAVRGIKTGVLESFGHPERDQINKFFHGKHPLYQFSVPYIIAKENCNVQS